jgi:NADH-quinone oxidoreductase subunit I
MSNEYELARDNRQDLIFTKEQLLAPLLPGMEQPPHAMRLGDSEKDYYVGALTNPGTSAGAERSEMGPGLYDLTEHPGVDFPGAEQQAQREEVTP